MSEVAIRDAADKFELPCQRVHAVTVTVCRRPDSNRRWLTPGLKATDLDHSATTLCQFTAEDLLKTIMRSDCANDSATDSECQNRRKLATYLTEP